MEIIKFFSDALLSFADNCVDGLELNTLKIVHQAHNNNMSLAEAAESLDLYTSEEFDDF